MKMSQTKIAIPTDDGKTISRHFGQAQFFQVVTIENEKVVHSEMRTKANHQHGDHSHASGTHPGQQMVDAIKDCQVLIAGGMGTPAHTRAVSAGLVVIMTRLDTITAATEAYISKTLISETQLIHSH